MAKSKTKVLVTGDKEIDRLLRGIPAKFARKAMRQVMRPEMKTVAATAEQLAPKDTGAGADAIRVRAMKAKRGQFGVQATTGKGSLFQGDYYYMAFQEFGTVDLPAQPYMRPAYDQHEASSIRNLKAKLPAEVESVVKDAKAKGKL